MYNRRIKKGGRTLVENNKILVGKGLENVYLLPQMANRHGLIAGATGTGKTVTLKVMAEAFSELGVPVFLADIKGDLSGMCKKGEESEKIVERIEKLGLNQFSFGSFPTRFFDVFGEQGHPVRSTISEMGPMLLGRLLNLTDVQAGVLNIVFRIADDHNLLLIDLKDLRAMVQYVGEHNKEYTEKYGNIATQSIGAIQRALLTLEDNGGNIFFAEPSLDIMDWMGCDESGRGYINILACEKLFHSPLLYSTFLLWMLSELFENMPEVGDMEKPKMVFFFDEAHLLFQDAPKTLVQKIEQVVKLIRSKGIGVYFITQNPMDIPDSVLAQLGNRVQHALRAYTPAEMKAVNVAAQSFRENPAFKTKDAICELATGEALVSFLDEEGKPEIVQRAFICPPSSFMGMIDDERRRTIISSSNIYGKYEKEIDRESAYEILQEARRIEQEEAEKEAVMAAEAKAKKKTSTKKSVLERAATNAMSTVTRETGKSVLNMVTGKKSKNTKSVFEKAANSAISTLSNEMGKTVSRGLFGILKK